MTGMTIFSIVAIISFILNMIQYLDRIKNRKDFNNEIEHEKDDIVILHEKIKQISSISNDPNKTAEEKAIEIAKICDYCEGYLLGAEEHLPHKKLII